MSKRFALLVGMTAYPDDRLNVTTSSQAIRTLVERLRDPENGRFDRVVPLLNQTALDLQLGIASFFEQEMEPGDLVLFYFAGHSLIHHQNVYLATTDTFTEEYLDATTVEIDFVRRRLNGSPAQQVVILDCHFSRIGATDRHTDGFEMLAQALQAKNRAVLIAPERTSALLEGLQGAADSNQDGAITFAELCGYMQSQLPAEATPLTIATQDDLDSLALASCAAKKTAVPLVPPPPITETDVVPPPPASNRRRTGMAALILLLLFIVFGVYAVSSGLFSGDDAVVSAPEPSATTAVIAIPPEASKTPSPTATTEAAATAVATKLPTATETAVVSKTATPKPTNTPKPTTPSTSTATASPAPSSTAKPTVTKKPTATSSTTPAPTSESVPMDVVARQAFLRAGPGINYRILDFPDRGTAVSVIGRNSDATWYNVILEDGTRGWLHVDVLASDDEDAFDDIAIAATIPVPSDDFYDPNVTSSSGNLRLEVYHTYVGTQGDNARLEARLLPETTLVQPTYLSGQTLGLGQIIVEFNRVSDGDYRSEQVEVCMVSATGTPFYCETFPAWKSW